MWLVIGLLAACGPKSIEARARLAERHADEAAEALERAQKAWDALEPDALADAKKLLDDPDLSLAPESGMHQERYPELASLAFLVDGKPLTPSRLEKACRDQDRALLPELEKAKDAVKKAEAAARKKEAAEKARAEASEKKHLAREKTTGATKRWRAIRGSRVSA